MRLYYGTYGHRLSGKLYAYWGDDNLRTGQQVVAPVTHAISGKNYQTMFTIARAQSGANTQGEEARLTEGGIFIKTIDGRDTLSLPGGAAFSSKAEWKRDSDRRYREKWSRNRAVNAVKKPVSVAVKNVPTVATTVAQTAHGTATAPPKSIENVTPKKNKKPRRKKSKKARRKAFKAAQKIARQQLGTLGKTLEKYGKDDKAMDAARSSLSKNKTAADSFKQKDRLKEIKGREAFRKEE